ncbi:MAG: alpha/beta hydrolase [Actinomycetota bacterium]
MTATVVLVHGAWHGAWSWQPVTRRLRSKRIDVRPLDLPGHGDSPDALGDLDADAAAITAVLDDVDGPVVLVGHSLGGAAITAAGRHDAVIELAYVAAFAPDQDESVGDLAAKYPIEYVEPPFTVGDDGTATLTAYGLDHVLYHDASTAVDTAARLVVPENPAKFAAPGGLPAWRFCPSTYVRCTDDRIVHRDLQTFMAERAGARIFDLECGHMPMFASPDELTTIITELARG